MKNKQQITPELRLLVGLAKIVAELVGESDRKLLNQQIEVVQAAYGESGAITMP